jgi:putative transposase
LDALEFRAQLNGMVARRPRWGLWKLYDRSRLEGRRINHMRLHRVYCLMMFNLPRRTKRRLPTRIRQPLLAPVRLNEIWALDFMADALYGGRPFRTLNVIDEGNREVLGIEIATSIPARRVIRVMEQLIEIYGKPDQNAFIERFNKTYRNQVLDAYVFNSLDQVREITEAWLPEYNKERPHDSLGRVPPLTFLPRQQLPAESTYERCA